MRRRKVDREARSTTGVPMIPVGLKFRTGDGWTGGPISVRDQITGPVVGIERINIIRFGHAMIIGPFGPPSM